MCTLSNSQRSCHCYFCSRALSSLLLTKVFSSRHSRAQKSCNRSCLRQTQVAGWFKCFHWSLGHRSHSHRQEMTMSHSQHHVSRMTPVAGTGNITFHSLFLSSLLVVLSLFISSCGSLFQMHRYLKGSKGLMRQCFPVPALGRLAGCLALTMPLSDAFIGPLQTDEWHFTILAMR